jgi:DNA modification methylase
MSSILSQVTDGLFTAIHGDCVEAMADLPSESVGLSIFSPPFSHLFIYSDSERDMGNASDDAEFLEHYRFLVRDLFRVTKPGRLCVVHCSDLPRTKSTHGEVALYDLPGDIRAVHEAEGWTYHSRVTIWKDPVVEMQRTKALGLLHKQLLKDSCRSRVGMPDYLLVFRKTPADEKTADKVGHDAREFPVDLWQQWASPVWMDIDQTDVLNVRIARDDKDEKHLCPLQLDLIDRAIRLWSNPGDVVLSPFMGVGSEGWGALRAGRKFVGIELKEAYFKQAVKNLSDADQWRGSDLFSSVAAE